MRDFGKAVFMINLIFCVGCVTIGLVVREKLDCTMAMNVLIGTVALHTFVCGLVLSGEFHKSTAIHVVAMIVSAACFGGMIWANVELHCKPQSFWGYLFFIWYGAHCAFNFVAGASIFCCNQHDRRDSYARM
jgi:hypothetical protein